MPHRLMFSALLCGLFAAFPGGGAEIGDGLRGAAEYRVVTADFRQLRRLKELGMELTIRGSMASERNGRLRWQVDSPTRSVTLIGKETLRHFDRETGKTAVIRKESFPWLKIMGDAMNDWLTGDPERLARRFKVSRPSPDTLLLAPTDPGLLQFCRSVELSFSSDRRELRKIRIDEPSGDELEINFFNVKHDPPLPPDFWRMPPE